MFGLWKKEKSVSDVFGPIMTEPVVCTMIYNTDKFWVEHSAPNSQYSKRHRIRVGEMGEIGTLYFGHGDTYEEAYEDALSNYKVKREKYI